MGSGCSEERRATEAFFGDPARGIPAWKATLERDLRPGARLHVAPRPARERGPVRSGRWAPSDATLIYLVRPPASARLPTGARGLPLLPVNDLPRRPACAVSRCRRSRVDLRIASAGTLGISGRTLASGLCLRLTARSGRSAIPGSAPPRAPLGPARPPPLDRGTCRAQTPSLDKGRHGETHSPSRIERVGSPRVRSGGVEKEREPGWRSDRNA